MAGDDNEVHIYDKKPQRDAKDNITAFNCTQSLYSSKSKAEVTV